MKKTIRWSIICLSSLLASSCIHRADSLRMLEERADYEGKDRDEASELKLGDDQVLHDKSAAVPMRTKPKTAQIWIFPHETPSKEYFWGGWISVVVEGRWLQKNQPRHLQPIKRKRWAHDQKYYSRSRSKGA